MSDVSVASEQLFRVVSVKCALCGTVFDEPDWPLMTARSIEEASKEELGCWSDKDGTGCGVCGPTLFAVEPYERA